MIRIISILTGVLLFCYIAFTSVFFRDWKTETVCNDLEIVVKDSLEKHFVTESDVLLLLKQAKLDPIDQPMSAINTELIETELMKNDMISNIEAYKTPSGKIKLEITQKMPILRIMSQKGNYYVDNNGGIMPLSRRYTAYVPVASGYIEKEFASGELYNFAWFLNKNRFWYEQIEQIHIQPNQDVELIPRVGNHRIILGSFDNYEEKLENLQLFYEQVIPKMGWDKYSIINLKYKDQIVCTKK